MASSDQREFDLVLWGATGFTGSLVASYLARHPDAHEGKGLRWAIAGRNREKLEDLRRGLGDDFADLPILIADCFDRESLDAMAARTKVICTTVGPYFKYGAPLVAACVEAGTDYCDLTGEAHFIRQIIDEHHEEATKKGVRIVNCCGFDSIPSDLGVLLLQREALRSHEAPCEVVKFFVWKLSGGVSGGTIDSVATMLESVAKDRQLRRLLADPYALNPDDKRSGPDGPPQQGLRHDPSIDAWTGPFIMAAINEKVVRRSNALLHFPYGEDFRYSESSRMGTGVAGALRAGAVTAGFGAFGVGMLLKPTRKALRRFVLPSPGQGPSEKTIEEGYFSVRLVGHGRDAEGQPFMVTAEVGADQDPGYGATAMMLGESALCLALDDVNDGLPGGILTPATAMGEDLIERLRAAGMTFEIPRWKPTVSSSFSPESLR